MTLPQDMIFSGFLSSSGRRPRRARRSRIRRRHRIIRARTLEGEGAGIARGSSFLIACRRAWSGASPFRPPRRRIGDAKAVAQRDEQRLARRGVRTWRSVAGSRCRSGLPTRPRRGRCDTTVRSCHSGPANFGIPEAVRVGCPRARGARAIDRAISHSGERRNRELEIARGMAHLRLASTATGRRDVLGNCQ